MNRIVDFEFRTASHVISSLDPDGIVRAADMVTEAIRSGHTVYFLGNGGSSADAQHLAGELSGKYLFDRPGMPGACLSNIVPVTAIGNDYDFDSVFSRQVDAFVREGDVVIGISTSGNSRNVLRAMERARELGAVTMSFSGEGGVLKDIVDHAVIVRSRETPHIQEGYLVAGHMMCCLVERSMFGRKAVFVDRDDTLVPDVPYCHDPRCMMPFDGVPEAVRRLNDAGYLVIMVTNQSGIGRGLLTEDDLETVNHALMSSMASGGGRIDDVFFCPHRPEDGCECRKPGIGMGVAAVKKYHIDVRRSFMIGDSDSDMEFGRELGCRTLRVGEGFSFTDAVDVILGG